MHPEAFARARRFLQYNPVATWGAILASVGLALMYVALLATLGLFADLIVERGRIPAFAKEDALWLSRLMGPEESTAVKEAIEKGQGVGLVSLAVRVHRQGAWYESLFTLPVKWFDWTRHNGSYLTGLLILSLSLALAWSLLVQVMHTSAAIATVDAATRLRRAVYHQTYRLGTLAFRALGTSEAIGIFTRHLEAVVEGLYLWLTSVFREPAKAVCLLLFALLVESGTSGGIPWLSITFLLFAVLFWLVEGQLAAYFRRQERRNTMQATEQIALLQESLQILRLVKCFLMELFNQSRVERQLVRYAATLQRRYRGKALHGQTLVLLGVVAAAVLLYAAGWNILNGNLSVAATITVVAALFSLYWPVWNWLEQQRTIRRARQAAGVVFKFLDRQGDVGQAVGAEFLSPMSNLLEFDNVSLKEPGTGRTLLEEVTLQIPAGQRLAIVGQDELEKHALVYLIPRFLDPKEGEIRIDGHNLRWVTLESLRVQVALVLQHSLVFNDTVANNIGCGDTAYTLPQIIEAAKTAHAHHFIQRLPTGYETRIGELGHTLNTTEQFRIALARAILRDPSLVIIEEPISTIDDNIKVLIDDTYARFLPERTTIFLPHRMGTIKSCDRVYLLHKGRVEAAGVHRELLSSSDLYRHIQYLEFNVFADQG